LSASLTVEPLIENAAAPSMPIVAKQDIDVQSEKCDTVTAMLHTPPYHTVLLADTATTTRLSTGRTDASKPMPSAPSTEHAAAPSMTMTVSANAATPLAPVVVTWPSPRTSASGPVTATQGLSVATPSVNAAPNPGDVRRLEQQGVVKCPATATPSVVKASSVLTYSPGLSRTDSTGAAPTAVGFGRKGSKSRRRSKSGTAQPTNLYTLSQFQKPLGVNLVGRRPQREEKDTPGPAAYIVTEVEKTKCKNAPKYTISGSSQVRSFSPATPGPGHYRMPTKSSQSRHVTQLAGKFGSEPRLKTTQSGQAPGPGEYNVAGRRGRSVPIGMKRKESRIRATPGPCTYTPSDAGLSNSPSAPMIGFQAAVRPNTCDPTWSMPGPGQYRVPPSLGHCAGSSSMKRSPSYTMSSTAARKCPNSAKEHRPSFVAALTFFTQKC
jgi:hypothetical protein